MWRVNSRIHPFKFTWRMFLDPCIEALPGISCGYWKRRYCIRTRHMHLTIPNILDARTVQYCALNFFFQSTWPLVNNLTPGNQVGKLWIVRCSVIVRPFRSYSPLNRKAPSRYHKASTSNPLWQERMSRSNTASREASGLPRPNHSTASVSLSVNKQYSLFGTSSIRFNVTVEN